MPVVTLSVNNTIIDDITLNSSAPTGVGNTGTIKVGRDTGSGTFRGLLKFDLGIIPNDVIINSATLSLNLSSPDNSAQTINMHKVIGSWTEGVTTWNTSPSFDANAFSSFTAGTAAGRINSINVKQLVQDWVNGIAANNGILLKNHDEVTSGSLVEFTSSEGVSGDAPTLTIDYTIPSTGKKCVEYVGKAAVTQNPAATNLTVALPSGVQTGDLLLIGVTVNDTGAVTKPVGWTLVHESVVGSWKYLLLYKFAGSNETSPTFSIGPGKTWYAQSCHFRNVKSVLSTSYRALTTTTTAFSPSTVDVTAPIDNTLFVLFNMDVSGYTFTPPLSYNEDFDHTVSGEVFQVSHRYMHKNRTQTPTEMQSTISTATVGTSAVLVLEPITNNQPSLTLTSPSDNQTLTEGNTLQIEGSATDSDNGNVVTIKYKINNSTPRALQSGVSNGSTPISFAKSLTYSNKRLWDGSTDVTGVDLAENTDHTLTVWVEDDQGGKSAEVTRNFQVIWNRPPTISGQNDSLGTITDRPTITYSAVDPEGNTFTFTEYLNGQQVRSFTGEAGQEYTFQLTHDAWIRLDLDVPHQAKIVATDSAGMSSERVYTFTRTETHIEFMLDYDNPDVQAFFTVDGMPKRILVTLERYLPPGSSIESVRVTNNYLDAQPTWEDATGAVISGRGYLFTNTTKTADDWAVCVWVTIAKGSADQRVHVYGYGGAFD